MPLMPLRRRLAAAAWLLVSGAVALQIWLTWFGTPNARLAGLAAPGPGSNVYMTAIAVVLAWMILGAAASVLTSSRTTRGTAIAVVCYACLALVYVNVMRERTYYGDFEDYFKAALSLREGTPLPPRYLYPPLWAGLLAPLAHFGEDKLLALAWLLNLLSTFGVFLLLPRVLARYGFSRPLAIAATLFFGVVNVPILRTLSYAQINMHVALGVMLALYWYPRRWLASAVVLALAVHLKISPLVLALPFLLTRDMRWAATFALSVAAIGVLPGLAYGWEPYGDVVDNLVNIERANGLAFRETSIDSFVRGTAVAFRIPLERAIWPLKAAFAAACLLVAAAHVRRASFVPAGAPAPIVYNAMPVLLILMVMVSPLVWEHHPVFLGLSYIVIATLLRQEDWLLFSFAYFLEFMLPTFDFYPWSYGRLLSPLILLVLAWRRRNDGPSEAFVNANRWLQAALQR